MAKRKNSLKKKKKKQQQHPHPLQRSSDWSNLPPELLQIIASCLPNLSDYVRLLAVCKPWRHALTPPNYLHLCLPWLLMSSDNQSAFTRRFLTLFPRKIIRIPLPDAQGKRIFGSSSAAGVLLLISRRSVSLLNPHTKDLTKLPPLSLLKRRDLRKAACISLPGNDSVVMISFEFSSTLVFCRTGNTSWTRIDVATQSSLADFTYHKNMFFILGSNGRTAIVDGITLLEIAEIPSPVVVSDYFLRRCLVESASGKLLLVVWIRKRYFYGEEKDNKKFKVFELELSDQQQPRWLRVRSIGDNALFLDDHGALSVEVGKFPECKGNCIYFVDPPRKEYTLFSHQLHYEVGCFDIDNGCVPNLSVGFSSIGKEGREVAWTVPSLC